MTTLAEVLLWGVRIGAVQTEGSNDSAVFAYDPNFVRSGIELSPLVMPLSAAPYRFPALSRDTFHGLPGLLADSLPDRYGSAVMDAWLASQGRSAAGVDAVERLCYTGSRGMGALEFKPTLGTTSEEAKRVDVAVLVSLASDILNKRASLQTRLAIGDRDPDEDQAGLLEILRVGASAGGARAKAVIAWNPTTQEVRSGQVPAPDGFEHWLLKFDGVDDQRESGLVESNGYGAIEYAYSEMAKAAGIQMTACQLLEEGGRRHFMTRRFDRAVDGDKLHMQTLGALAHLDYNLAGAHSYEQAFDVANRLRLPPDQREELYRRMVFNLVARNQDDHVKNIAFLMSRRGQWALAPAYDVTYSYNPTGHWTANHQMSVQGKIANFEAKDLRNFGRLVGLKRGRYRAIAGEVIDAVRDWQRFAEEAGVDEVSVHVIANAHRLGLLDS